MEPNYLEAVKNLEYEPEFVFNGQSGRKVLTEIEKGLLNCDRFDISVAFITDGGIEPLLPTFKQLEAKNIKGRILTTDYLTFTDPKAICRLHEFKNLEIKMFRTDEEDVGFHTKGYIFEDKEVYHIIVGSSNITQAALTKNKEWNIKINIEKSSALKDAILDEFEKMWNSESSKSYDDFIEQYKEDYVAQKALRYHADQLFKKPSAELKPNSMQEAFIDNLEGIVADGKDRALLISATGTGKTYASAFAMKHFNFKRVLFLVHRNQLATQTEKSYKKVFGNQLKTGLIGGGHNDYDADYVFATIQTISKNENLTKFKPDYFDCIILDEAHHSSANSYQIVLSYFKPKFWLGMTATPDKRDDNISGKNIYQIFNHEIAYEIRLQQAMEDDLLCPFHYFGISDIKMDDSKEMSKNNSKLSIRQLTSEERIKHIIDKINFYGYSGDRVKGLIFCSRLDEAYELSEKFNELGYNTIALSGKDSEERRTEAFERLAMDKKDASEAKEPLDYIFSVDILNEGVDIVEVNQVVMLRPTESPIVFIQQLGRGLRKNSGKEYVVILDFIGNYQQNFMIPVALSGNQSYNADVIKEFVISGIAVIPGASTIYFDEISKEKIFKAVENMKGLKDLIKTSYLNLKNRLGKIPSLCDFITYGEVDPKVIVEKHKSYFEFLVMMKEYDSNALDDAERNVIKYLSKTVMTGWRYYELYFLNELLKHGMIEKQVAFQQLQEILGDNFNEMSFNKSLYYLNGKFFAKKEELLNSKDLIVEIDNIYYLSDFLKEHLTNKLFKEQLLDLINTGFLKFEEKYDNALRNESEFILYENYTRRDVCYLLNENQDLSSTMYGEHADEKGENVCIFVNYNKDKFDEEGKNYVEGKPDYADAFEDNRIFRWDSQIGKGINSDYMNEVRSARKKHLFIKKSTKGKSFYYMGTFRIIHEEPATKKDNHNKDQDIAKVTLEMDFPVREDILNYLESKTELGDEHENS